MFCLIKKLVICSVIMLCFEQFSAISQDITLPEPQKSGGNAFDGSIK